MLKGETLFIKHDWFALLDRQQPLHVVCVYVHLYVREHALFMDDSGKIIVAGYVTWLF